MSDGVDVIKELQDTFYKKELQSFLDSYVVSNEDIKNGNAPPTAPTSSNQVLEDIKGVWQDKGFLHPADLRQELAQKYMPDADPKLLAVYNDIERSRYKPDSMTGYMQKQHLGAVSGLGHLYAQSTSGKIAMIEVDYSNMGGTNEYFRELMAKETGVNPATLNIQDSFKYTDDTAKLIAKSIQEELGDVLPEGAKVMPIRAGGDELRLIVTDIDPKDYDAVTSKVHNKIEDHMAKLGLHDHIHLKGPDNTLKNGFGAGVAIVDMNHLDPATAVEHADIEIKAQKENIGHDRLGIIDKDSLRDQYQQHYAKHPTPLPKNVTIDGIIDDAIARETAIAQSKQKAFSELKNTAPNIEAKEQYLKQEIDKTNINEADIIGGKHVDYIDNKPAQADVDLFTDPAGRRAEMIATEIKAQGIVVGNSYEQNYLKHLTESTTPLDPSAATWMPNDMPEMVEIYAQDTEKLKPALLEQGIDPKVVDSIKPHMMSTAYHNLGGLNDVIGHDGANIALKHMSQDIIGKAFEAEGLKVGDYQIAHYGGAEFQMIIPPAVKGADGTYHVIEPEQLKRIEVQIVESTKELNNTNIVSYLEKNDMPPSTEMKQALEGKTFADVADIKPDRNISGVDAVTHSQEVSLSDRHQPAGEMIYNHRSELDQKVSIKREDVMKSQHRAEIHKLAADSPALVEMAGSKEKLAEIVDNALDMDQKFNDRGGKFFEGGNSGKEVAENFQKTHLDDFAKKGSPSIIGMASHNADRLDIKTGTNAHDLVIKSAIAAEIDRSTVGGNKYHDINHFAQVQDHTAVLLERTEQLAKSGDPRVIQMSAAEKAATLSTAITHDLHHEGTGNVHSGDKFANEVKSYKTFEKIAQETNVDPKLINNSKVTFLATSPNGGTQFVEHVAGLQKASNGAKLDIKHVQETFNAKFDKGFAPVNFSDISPELKEIINDPKAVQSALHVTTADVAGSASSGLKSSQVMSKNLTEEINVGKSPGDKGYMDLTNKGSRTYFLNNIGTESHLPAAELLNENRGKMLKDTVDNMAAEKKMTDGMSAAGKENKFKQENIEAKTKMAEGMSAAGGNKGTFNKVAGHTGKTEIALNIAEGKYVDAAVGAAMEAAENEKVQQAALQVVEKTAVKSASSMASKIGSVALSAAKGLGNLGKRMPLVGAAITAVFVAVEVGKDIANGEHGKALAALTAGAAEAGGNLVGFGAGDAARQAVVEGVAAVAGEEYRADDAGLVALGKQAARVAENALEEDSNDSSQKIKNNEVAEAKNVEPVVEEVEQKLAAAPENSLSEPDPITDLPPSMAENEGKLTSAFTEASEGTSVDNAPTIENENIITAENTAPQETVVQTQTMG